MASTWREEVTYHPRCVYLLGILSAIFIYFTRCYPHTVHQENIDCHYHLLSPENISLTGKGGECREIRGVSIIRLIYYFS